MKQLAVRGKLSGVLGRGCCTSRKFLINCSTQDGQNALPKLGVPKVLVSFSTLLIFDKEILNLFF